MVRAVIGIAECGFILQLWGRVDGRGKAPLQFFAHSVLWK